MKILVCGATGFIGRNMAQYFAGLGHEVHAVRFNSPEYECENVTWHRCDLRENSYTLQALMQDTDIVIQAAATTSGSKDIINNPAIHVTDNAVMNSYIFRAAAEAKVKHVIFFSCTVMYGSGFATENSPIDIHPKYFGVAHTKLYCEKLCEFYANHSDTKFTVIRHSNIYGPHDKFDLERSHVFGATITKVMAAEDKITIWGSGKEGRDFLYVDDLCRFVEKAIGAQHSSFVLYNCGSGNLVSINDLVSKIIKLSGKELAVEHDLSAPTIPTSLCLDYKKAKKELNWEPNISLEDGISKTIAWWRENYV